MREGTGVGESERETGCGRESEREDMCVGGSE